MVLLDDNVNVVKNTHHTWHTTPIFEIHHDLHFFTSKPHYEFFEHHIDCHHTSVTMNLLMTKSSLQVKMFAPCVNL